MDILLCQSGAVRHPNPESSAQSCRRAWCRGAPAQGAGTAQEEAQHLLILGSFSLLSCELLPVGAGLEQMGTNVQCSEMTGVMPKATQLGREARTYRLPTACVGSPARGWAPQGREGRGATAASPWAAPCSSRDHPGTPHQLMVPLSAPGDRPGD